MSRRDDILRLDTSAIDALMDEFDAQLYRVTSTDVEVDGEGRARHNDPSKAEVSRGLLRAADIAEALATEVRQLYWQAKGYDDPRKDTA